jgi:hypothetical protein
MSLSDEIRNAYAGVLQSGLTGLALVDAVQKAMESMPEAEVAAILAKCGQATADRRSGAEYIAVAIQTIREAAPLLALLA